MEAGIAHARDSGIALILVDAGDSDGSGPGVIRTLRDEGNPAAILAIAWLLDSAAGAMFTML